MSETVKQLDPNALASLTTGLLLTDVGTMHEAAEHVMGHPIWTHEFADPGLWVQMRKRVLAQFPDMPVAAPDGWEALRDSTRARFGNEVAVERGDAGRSADPLTTLREVAGDKPIIVLAIEQ